VNVGVNLLLDRRPGDTSAGLIAVNDALLEESKRLASNTTPRNIREGKEVREMGRGRRRGNMSIPDASIAKEREWRAGMQPSVDDMVALLRM
jgi:hypothetical protein